MTAALPLAAAALGVLAVRQAARSGSASSGPALTPDDAERIRSLITSGDGTLMKMGLELAVPFVAAHPDLTADLEIGELTGQDLSHANLAGALFAGDIELTSFAGAQLSGAQFGDPATSDFRRGFEPSEAFWSSGVPPAHTGDRRVVDRPWAESERLQTLIARYGHSACERCPSWHPYDPTRGGLHPSGGGLISCSLANADLTGAVFVELSCRWTSFFLAHCDGALLEDVTFVFSPAPPGTPERAHLQGSVEAQPLYSSFAQARLRGATFRRVRFIEGAETRFGKVDSYRPPDPEPFFLGADLTGAVFEDCSIVGPPVKEANPGSYARLDQRCHEALHNVDQLLEPCGLRMFEGATLSDVSVGHVWVP